MKGFEAIKAMEEGKCVKSCHGFIVQRDGNYLQKWYKSESCWHTYSAAITIKQLLSDDWQIVPDPSKPPRYVAHMTCACCNAEIQSGGLVCSACMAKAKSKPQVSTCQTATGDTASVCPTCGNVKVEKELYCADCGTSLEGKPFRPIGRDGFVVRLCDDCAKPKQEPEPHTTISLPSPVYDACRASDDAIIGRCNIAAAILNECRRIAREEVERGEEMADIDNMGREE